VTRNAYAPACAFQSLADRAGVVLIAPLFTQAHFDDYQRLGRTGKRADTNLHKIISEVGALTGAQTDKVFLFGYSAYLFSPNGQLLDSYDKINLLSFIAYRRLIFPALFSHRPDVPEEFTPGNRATIFSLSDTRFGVIICV